LLHQLIIDYQPFIAVLPIYKELKDSSQITPIVRTSLLLCSVVYVTTSFFGFLLFGDSTLDDVLANFDTDLGIPYSSIFNDAVRVSYVLHLMLVFPARHVPSAAAQHGRAPLPVGAATGL
jgi:solute carrier family 38 (sodium-coupled neutral amino acid transporter), member 2